MAKVWHPDRFGHDPRLQQKAQEKLKEINEAFDILISGKVPRPKTEPPPEQERRPNYTADVPVRRSEHKHSFRWQWAALPILIFVVVFGFTLRSILSRNTGSTQPQAPESVASSEQQRSVGTAEKPELSRERRETGASAQVDAQSAPATEIRPLPTTTVTIDPASGLLARADCPSKTRMTYPSGNEPHGSCGLNHQQQSQADVSKETSTKSRVKSLTKKVATRLNGESKLDDWSRQ
jgi:cytoskeletal protein RodZ